MGHCEGSAISRDYIAYWSWDLRQRTGYSGLYGVHSGARQTEHFNATFWEQCGDIMRQLDLKVPMTPDWIGTAGAGTCYNKPASSLHRDARAFDITRVSYTDGRFIDTNQAWRGNTEQRRWYLGLACLCRSFVSTVLTAWFDSSHQNHIHIDNGYSYPPVRPSARADTVLVQAVCNIMVGDGTVIDGEWGPNTEAAYQRLKSQIKVCGNPKTNVADASAFWSLIASAGLNGRYAGAPGYQGSC